MRGWLPPTLLALLSYGIWSFVPKLAAGYLDPRSVVLFQIPGLLAVASLSFLGSYGPQFNARGILFALLMGAAGGIGSLMFVTALGRGKTAVVVTVTALYPLVTILLAFVVLKEPLNPRQAFGVLLALIAVALLSS